MLLRSQYRTDNRNHSVKTHWDSIWYCVCPQSICARDTEWHHTVSYNPAYTSAQCTQFPQMSRSMIYSGTVQNCINCTNYCGHKLCNSLHKSKRVRFLWTVVCRIVCAMRSGNTAILFTCLICAAPHGTIWCLNGPQLFHYWTLCTDGFWQLCIVLNRNRPALLHTVTDKPMLPTPNTIFSNGLCLRW